jgi:hypothetical protein
MQRVYDSEINAAIDWLWDGGFHIRLGDDLSGFSDDAYFMTWREVEAWLRERILERYPDSVFAREERPPIGDEAAAPDIPEKGEPYDGAPI